MSKSFDDRESKDYVLGFLSNKIRGNKRGEIYKIVRTVDEFCVFDAICKKSDRPYAVIEVKDRAEKFALPYYHSLLIECPKIEEWLKCRDEYPNFWYVNRILGSPGIWFINLKTLDLPDNPNWQEWCDSRGYRYFDSFNRTAERPGGERLYSDTGKRAFFIPKTEFFVFDDSDYINRGKNDE